MWYLNPKNILIIVLAVALAGMSITLGFTKIELAHVLSNEKILESSNLALDQALKSYKRSISATGNYFTGSQAVLGKIADVDSAIDKVKEMEATNVNCKNDAKISLARILIINDLLNQFNNSLRAETGNKGTVPTDMSTSVQTASGIDKIEMTDAYLDILIRDLKGIVQYVEMLELTVKCYEESGK